MARAVCGWKAGAESVVFCVPDVFAHAAERMERLGVYIRQKYVGSGK